MKNSRRKFSALNKQKRLFETQERLLKDSQKKQKQMTALLQDKEKKLIQLVKEIEQLKDENKVFEMRNHNLNESLNIYRNSSKNM